MPQRPEMVDHAQDGARHPGVRVARWGHGFRTPRWRHHMHETKLAPSHARMHGHGLISSALPVVNFDHDLRARPPKKHREARSDPRPSTSHGRKQENAQIVAPSRARHGCRPPRTWPQTKNESVSEMRGRTRGATRAPRNLASFTTRALFGRPVRSLARWARRSNSHKLVGILAKLAARRPGRHTRGRKRP